MNDFLDVLAKLENEIRQSKRTVLGGSKYIDGATCMDYIFTLKDLIPTEIKEARLLLSEREEILSSARAEADDVLNNAYNEMNRILDQSEIITQANREAQIIVSKAKNYVANIKHEAAVNINDLMVTAEDKIINVLNVIRECQSDLQNSGLDEVRR